MSVDTGTRLKSRRLRPAEWEQSRMPRKPAQDSAGLRWRRPFEDQACYKQSAPRGAQHSHSDRPNTCFNLL